MPLIKVQEEKKYNWKGGIEKTKIFQHASVSHQ